MGATVTPTHTALAPIPARAGGQTATATAGPLPPLLDPPSKLARDCEQYQSFAARPMVPGQIAIDFTLKDTKGKDYTLSNLLAEKPVVMIFGSFT